MENLTLRERLAQRVRGRAGAYLNRVNGQHRFPVHT